MKGKSCNNGMYYKFEQASLDQLYWGRDGVLMTLGNFFNSSGGLGDFAEVCRNLDDHPSNFGPDQFKGPKVLVVRTNFKPFMMRFLLQLEI